MAMACWFSRSARWRLCSSSLRWCPDRSPPCPRSFSISDSSCGAMRSWSATAHPHVSQADMATRHGQPQPILMSHKQTWPHTRIQERLICCQQPARGYSTRQAAMRLLKRIHLVYKECATFLIAYAQPSRRHARFMREWRTPPGGGGGRSQHSSGTLSGSRSAPGPCRQPAQMHWHAWMPHASWSGRGSMHLAFPADPRHS